jgi:hypothetical protein
VFLVRQELGFYIPEDGIFHRHSRENLKSSDSINRLGFVARRNLSPVKYKNGFYIAEDGILHSHRRGNLESYKRLTRFK